MRWLLCTSLVTACAVVDPAGVDLIIDRLDYPPGAAGTVDVFDLQLQRLPVDIVVIAQDSCCTDVQQYWTGQGLADLLTDLDRRGADVHVGVFTSTASPGLGGHLFRLPDGRRWITQAEADDALALLNVGRTGSPDERGLRSAWDGLNSPLRETVNEGFRRPDAELHLIAMGSEDDQSRLDPSVPAFAALIAREQPSPTARSFSAVVCTDPADGCPTSEYAPRYLDLVQRLGGAAIPYDGDEAIAAQIRELGRDILEPLELVLTQVPDPASIRVEATAGTWSWSGAVDPAACVDEACGVAVFDPVRNSVTPRWDAPDRATGQVSISYTPAR